MNADEYKSAGKDKLQEYGKEGLAPLMELFNKYGDDIEKYIHHVRIGLAKGSENLKADPTSSPESDMVASWFEQGATWVEKLKGQLEKKDTDSLLKFVETQGRQHPAALFATSLIAGSVFGVVGKKAFKARSSTLNETSQANPNANL